MALFTIYLVVLLGLVVLEIVLLELEHFGRATLLMLGTALAVQFFGVCDLWHGLLNHPVQVLEYAVGYVLFGVVWSFFKWWRHLAHWRFEYKEARNGWLSKNNFSANVTLTDQQRTTMLQNIGYKYVSSPTASANKSRITAWMCFWVFSMIGWALNEPVRRIFNSLFNLFKGTYQRIADYMFKDFPELK